MNHDRLMHRLSTKIADKRVLKLIRKYLESGVMVEGVHVETVEGTPQGGPLSPLLSNVVLDELDKELEKRSLKFVRYADDCVIYVGSQRAGDRVMASVSKFIVKRLRLKVNEEKSSVGRPWKSKYLGFSLTDSRSVTKIRIHWKSLRKMKDKVKEITSRTRGRSFRHVVGELNEYLRGWWGYFGIANSVTALNGVDNWIRRRLRAYIWKQWKNRRTRVRELHKRGISKDKALLAGCARKGPWRMSGVKWVSIALPNKHLKSFGLAIPWI